MTKFEEKYNEFKEFLKGSLTGDNVDFITTLTTHLDELNTEHKSVEQENSSLKDKIVEYVKNTTFKEPPKEETHNEDKSIDEILTESIDDIIANRKEK